MAESITIKALQDASLDAKSLEEVVNGNESKQVTTRLGETYPSVKKAINTMFENGGLPATPFATKALMGASALVDGDYAMVTDDTVNNGLYVKTAGAWVKSTYEPLMQSIANSNALFKPRALTVGQDLDTLESGYYRIPSTEVASSLINLPADMTTPKIGYLFVFKEAGVAYQHIIHYTSVAVEEFKRVGNGSSSSFAYKAWQKDIELSDVQALIANLSSNQGFLIAPLDGLDFKNATTTLEVKANRVRVVYDKTSKLLLAQTLPYPTSGVYNLIYNVDSNNLSWQLSSIAPTAEQIVVGGFITATQTVIGIDSYSIDGRPFDASTVKGDLVGDPEFINFGFDTDNTLSITAYKIRLSSAGKSYLLPARSVSLPVSGDSYWYQIVYDPKIGELSLIKISDIPQGNGVIVGWLQRSTKSVYGINGYYINGAPKEGGSGGNDFDLKTDELVVYCGDDTANYVQPELAEYQTWLTANLLHTDVYGLYDTLMSAHPDYITRTSLGLDDSGNTIYRYDFKPSPVESATQSGDLAKMIAISGIHGMEKAGIYNTYLALKQICERWQDDSKLETLRWNIHFIAIPVAVPTGFDRNTRKNINDVDIARNFPSGWVQGNPSDVTYGGASPLSEKEAQYINTLYAANTDAIYCFSHHNFGVSTSDVRFIWNASATRFGARLAKSLIRNLTVRWKERYPFINSNYVYMGISNTQSPTGSEGKHATEAYGIQAGTFEIANGLVGDVEMERHSSSVATLGCEALINWLILNLKYGSALTNLKQ